MVLYVLGRVITGSKRVLESVQLTAVKQVGTKRTPALLGDFESYNIVTDFRVFRSWP